LKLESNNNMAQHHTPTSIGVLNILRERGSANYLEIEHSLNMANVIDRIRSLRQHGYIEALPKERGQLKRYKLTTEGSRLIGLHIKQQSDSARNVMSLPKYVPQVCTPARAGAMRAFSIPSRGIKA